MNSKEKYIEMSQYEDDLKANGFKNICGIDEVGRGPLAGPAVVAGVILSEEPILGINDSKKLSKKRIDELYTKIIDNCYNYCIKIISVKDIEKYGIKNCVVHEMNEISKELDADYYLIDYEKIDCENSLSITKGDLKSVSIAAASIIAKKTRDEIMIDISKKYPNYDFENNVGYGTKKHLEALNEYGYIKGIHRRNFNPVKSMIEKENDEII